MATSRFRRCPQSGAIFSELASVTRRAFVRSCLCSSILDRPCLFYMLGNAQRAAGGLNQVTVPCRARAWFRDNGPGTAAAQFAVITPAYRTASGISLIGGPGPAAVRRDHHSGDRPRDQYPQGAHETTFMPSRARTWLACCSPTTRRTRSSRTLSTTPLTTAPTFRPMAASTATRPATPISRPVYQSELRHLQPGVHGLHASRHGDVAGRVTDAAGGEAPTFVS